MYIYMCVYSIHILILHVVLFIVYQYTINTYDITIYLFVTDTQFKTVYI